MDSIYIFYWNRLDEPRPTRYNIPLLHLRPYLSLEDAVEAAKIFARGQDLRLHVVENDEWRLREGSITSPINEPGAAEYRVTIGKIPVGGYSPL